MGIFSKWLKGNSQQTPNTTTQTAVISANPSKQQVASATSLYDSQRSVKQRMQALKQTHDITVLLNAYCHDSDDLVVDCADMRLRDVLTHHDDEAPIGDLLATALSLKTRKTLAAKAQSEALRHAMLAQLDDDQSLSEVIAYSDDWHIKTAAIERLSDTDTLKTLIKQYKGKQKAAFRAAKNRLDNLKNHQQMVNDLQSLLATLITNAESQTLSISAVTQFEQQLNHNISALSPDEQRIFSTPLAQLHQAAKEISTAKNARHTILQCVEQACDELQSQSFSGTRKTFNALINQQQQAWTNLPAWQAAESKALHIRFEQLLSQANETAGQYFNEQYQQNARQKLLNQCQRWLDKPTFITDEMLVDMHHRWEVLAPPTDVGFNSLFAQLRDKSQQQLLAQQANDEAVPALLQQLQSALDNGKTQQANTLHASIRERLNSEAKLSKAIYQQIMNPLKRQENRLHELKQWQHFGDDQARQTLIDSMQTLTDDNQLAIEDKAEKIQALQQQWKALKGRAPNHLWKQFKMLGDSAWQPVASHLKQQRQTSKNDLSTRLDFLHNAEQQLETIDWQNPNWESINNAHKSFEQQWRNFPKLQEHDYCKAKKAYQQVANIWDNQLGAERKRELQRRERLIKQAQALLESDDTRSAVDTIKQLQQQWSPSIGLKRREQEQALWQRFKSACDAVFAQHGEQRAQAQSAENATFDTYKINIQSLARIVDNDELDFEQKKSDFYHQLNTLQQQPTDKPSETDSANLNSTNQKTQDFIGVSGKAAHTLRKQLNAVIQQFEVQEQRIASEQRLNYVKQLFQQDVLCTQLESQTLTGEQQERIQQQWQSINPLLNDGQTIMRKRFDSALTRQQHNQPSCKTLEQLKGIEQAQEICLLLELSGELPSPTWAQPDREALRLKVLDAAMNGDKFFEQYQSDDGLYRLAQRWFSLDKSTLVVDEHNSSLNDWQKRFTDSFNHVRAHHQLSTIKFSLPPPPQANHTLDTADNNDGNDNNDENNQ